MNQSYFNNDDQYIKELMRGEGKIKKILVLVQCPFCRREFYIDEKLLHLEFKGQKVLQQCKLCHQHVNLIML